MAVYVVDTVMGGGKTEASIAYMDAHSNQRFLFVTPLLSECDRIISSCKNHEFYQPTEEGEKVFSKTASLGILLSQKHDIVMSHSLFLRAIGNYRKLILEGEYSLVQDETFDLIRPVDFAEVGANLEDIKCLIDLEVLNLSENEIVRKNPEFKYEGRIMKQLFEFCEGSRLLLHGNTCWDVFDTNVFRWFKEVHILTYLFEYSNQRCMMDINGISYNIIGAKFGDEGYKFTDKPYVPEYAQQFIDRINIENSERLNAIGDDYYALSSSWYGEAIEVEEETLTWDTERDTLGRVQKEDRSGVANMGVHINSFFGKCRKDTPGCQVLWTSYKKGQKMIETNGFQRGFLSCNQRASNRYSDRTCLAYCVNVFPHPYMARYFNDKEQFLDRDGYALSEMIQWVWRSAIRTRDGSIRIYIPSRRMRLLFTCWLEELRDGRTGVDAPKRFRELIKEQQQQKDNEKAKTARQEEAKQKPKPKKKPKKKKYKKMGKRAKAESMRRRLRKMRKIGEFAEGPEELPVGETTKEC